MKCLTILSSALVLACSTPAWAAAPAKPNVVVILTDDMGYSDVGFNGCTDIPTPHIDSLAKNGLRCTNAYVTHPVCSPTRAALLSGRYQQRFGHEKNPFYDPADKQAGLPLTEFTLPQALKTAGYTTGAVGKWHLGAHEQFHPQSRGFDTFFGFRGGGHKYLPNQLGGTEEYTTDLERGRTPIKETEYLTDAFSREASAFVRQNKDQPFFLYLAYNAPHTPLQATPKYLERFKTISDPKRRTYAAMLSAVDDGVGNLLTTLQELKLEEKTLIFFLSDNGGPVGQASNGSSNGPLRGGKGTIFEGGIRVPFAVQWKGTLPAGKVYEQPVSSLDIYASAVALSGATLPPERKLDGVNLMPFLTGQNAGAPHDVLYWRTGGGAAFAVRMGSSKLALPANGRKFLFDLPTDLGEKKDLFGEQPEVVTKLMQLKDAWNAQLIPTTFRGLGDEKQAASQPAKAK